MLQKPLRRRRQERRINLGEVGLGSGSSVTAPRRRGARSGSRSRSRSHGISLARRLFGVASMGTGGRRAYSGLLGLVLVCKGFSTHRTAVAIGVWELGSEAVAEVCRFAVS